MREEERKTKKR